LAQGFGSERARIRMFLRELGVDIAPLVEPFVRAISEFSADQESVAPDRFRRAYPSRQKPTVKTHGRAITAS
jgi:hypothetical protein